MSEKIFPRNLTARATRQVVGNPVTTRLESGVGNCYPGLEFDQRNLDQRFFPGLVFEFLATDGSPQGTARAGARLLKFELNDSELNNPDRAEVAKQLRIDLQAASQDFAQGEWYLHFLEQGGSKIPLFTTEQEEITPLDGMVVWRLVRSLEPDQVKLTIVRRTALDKPTPPTPPLPSKEIELSGWRRIFVDGKTGVIEQVYKPGELTQSLCSPWQHDFRDCSCFYWASNHPDIVLGEDTLGEPTLPSGSSSDSVRANTPIVWERSDRSPDSRSAALENNRPFEMDHYEISQRWQELAVVLRGKEISQIYRPPNDNEHAAPFKDPDELAAKLHELAGLEHVLCLEYLYAMYSLLTPGEANTNTWPKLGDHLIFVRHELLLIAVSEMRHLRWVNQLLWELDHVQPPLLKKSYGPALEVATEIPTGGGHKRSRQLRPLNRSPLNDFIAVEAPSGGIDGQYARVLATLRQSQYPDTLYQLAGRIIADGVEHFSKFSEIETVLRPYHRDAEPEDFKPPYLRNIALAPSNNSDAQNALNAYRQILANLETAYKKGNMEDAENIIYARQKMMELDGIAKKLATEGFGIPFF